MILAIFDTLLKQNYDEIREILSMDISDYDFIRWEQNINQIHLLLPTGEF